MSKGSVENYSFISIKQLNLKSLFSADHLKKYKNISITASNDYGSFNLSLTHSPCNYGGVRFWFLCSCGKRCTKLYFRCRTYACRQCQQLNYMSQQWNKSDIPLLRVRRLRNRLEWSQDVRDWPIYQKPKNMHYKTFAALGEVLKQCKNVNNAFLEPLLYSEVKATAKSIARYCWKKDGYHYQEFIDRQSKKGAIGGKISKRKPVPTSEATTKPWLALGISQSTYYRRKKLKNL